MPPTSRSLARPSQLSKINWLEIIKMLGAFVIAVATAYGTIKLDQSTMRSDIDHLKEGQKGLAGEIVPRAEHEAHWKALDDKLNSIQQDVREIRSAQIQQTRSR